MIDSLKFQAGVLEDKIIEGENLSPEETKWRHCYENFKKHKRKVRPVFSCKGIFIYCNAHLNNKVQYFIIFHEDLGLDESQSRRIPFLYNDTMSRRKGLRQATRYIRSKIKV